MTGSMSPVWRDGCSLPQKMMKLKMFLKKLTETQFGLARAIDFCFPKTNLMGDVVQKPAGREYVPSLIYYACLGGFLVREHTLLHSLNPDNNIETILHCASALHDVPMASQEYQWTSFACPMLQRVDHSKLTALRLGMLT